MRSDEAGDSVDELLSDRSDSATLDCISARAHCRSPLTCTVTLIVIACIFLMTFWIHNITGPSLQTGEISRRAQTDVEAVSIPTTLAGALTSFEGSWKLSQIDGNMDAFLEKMKWPWWKRQIAATMHYGIGEVFQHIKQTGSTFQMREQGPAGIFISRVTVGAGGGQPWYTGDGMSVKVDPSWNGAELLMQMHNLDGTPGPKVQRYLQDGKMVERSTFSGVAVKQIYSPV
mmetsp:Transcript_4749/g.9753  ORF Transcript_4749/g.9753 Transcript_4749/m.9753 type:complete len:230 (-) Transcript_4749:93-782(-)